MVVVVWRVGQRSLRVWVAGWERVRGGMAWQRVEGVIDSMDLGGILTIRDCCIIAQC